MSESIDDHVVRRLRGWPVRPEVRTAVADPEGLLAYFDAQLQSRHLDLAIRWLQAQGPRTALGNAGWSFSTAHNLLGNRAYLGEVHWGHYVPVHLGVVGRGQGAHGLNTEKRSNEDERRDRGNPQRAACGVIAVRRASQRDARDRIERIREPGGVRSGSCIRSSPATAAGLRRKPALSNRSPASPLLRFSV